MWKAVKGYEGLYEVSSSGEVRNARGHIKKKQEDKDGYFKVSLSKGSKKTPYMIHRLVAIHFVDNPNNKPIINHIDGNKKNNNADNLEWVTRSENDLHAFRLGLRKPTCGGTSKRVAQYDKEGNLIAKYESMSDAARKTGFTIQNISYAINGRQPFAYGYKWIFIGKGVTTS